MTAAGPDTGVLEGTDLLCQVKASVVCYKDPADEGTQKSKGPGDPKLVAVAQVVEPHDHQDGAHLTSGSRDAVRSAPDLCWVHLQPQANTLCSAKGNTEQKRYKLTVCK